MYTPVNPKFDVKKWGVRGSSLHSLVSVMILADIRIVMNDYLAYLRKQELTFF